MPAVIGQELQQLPLGFLLSSPLTAAIDAQALAAKSTIDFIFHVGLEEDDDYPGEYRARTADFNFKQAVPDPNNPGAVEEYYSTLTVPLLAIVPIPYIRISDLNVSFEFKIRDVQTASSKFEVTGSTGFENTTEVQGSMGGGILGFFGGPSGSMNSKTKIQVNASVTYQSTNRATTDRSATYKMTMNAVQDNIPEGLSRVLTILNDAIKSTKK